MNAALILSGGCGRRFGSDLPKQYHTVFYKMIVEYVIEAAESADLIDQILVAATLPCQRLARLQNRHDFEMTAGGERRNDSLMNGLTWLHERGCDRVIVLDAVRPLVTGAIIDQYMQFLEEGYDAVTTAQVITDSLGCYDMHEVDRSRYYLMQSPEAFRFPLLYQYFDRNSPLTEVIQQLPADCKIKQYFEFKNNLKLTYPWEMSYIELSLRNRLFESISEDLFPPFLRKPR